MTIKKGKFIVFEGPDGIGKTTIIKEIEKKMLLEGLEVVTTREPGGTDLAESIRNAIFEYGPDIAKSSQLHLFHAARIIHFIEKIKPALDAGITVICDRHYLSTIVYQENVRDVVRMTRELLMEYEDVFYNIILNAEDIDVVVDTISNERLDKNSYDQDHKIKVRQESYNKLFLLQDEMQLVGQTYIMDVNRDIENNMCLLYPLVLDILSDE